MSTNKEIVKKKKGTSIQNSMQPSSEKYFLT